MKKIVFTAAIIMAAAAVRAQQDLNTAQDAVRYSLDNLTGTARFRAMGGAFGAVGGDLSAIGINPAGSAVFMYNTGTVTGSSYNNNNQADFYSSRTNKNHNSFDLNQIGGIFVFTNNNENATMNKFTLGFNYENTRSFENSMVLSGVNPSGSIADYFLRYANGIGNEGGINLGFLDGSSIGNYPNMDFIDQQAYLGYNAYAFNPVSDDPNNTSYVSNAPRGNNYQESHIATTGFNGKVALNFAVQLAERFYLGANANVHFTDYINRTSFYEDTNNSGAGLQQLEFNTERYTYGGGFSFNLGGIAKITESLRAGVAYESPTWLSLQDEVTQNINSVVDGTQYFTNPQVTMVGDDYTVRTPSKWTGSLAYIFGRNGLLSVDYSVRDYSNTKYQNFRYSTLNNELSQTLDWAGELRVGTEWRIKNVSLRGGYRFQQSPYKNGTTVGDLNSFSGGIGFNLGGSRLDIAYAWLQRKDDVSLFTPGLTDAARVKTTANNVTVSFTMDL